MNEPNLKYILEAALLAAGQPLSIDQLMDLFEEHQRPDRSELRAALGALAEDYADRSVELVEVASGFRIQVRPDYSQAISRLWQERPPRYSRALMETLALIAYRQPITRGEIEEIRGVSVSTNIMRSLLERSWVRIVGHRDVPGRPAMYGTTREFLDYFGLKSLDEMPPLGELRDLDKLEPELDLLDPSVGEAGDPAGPRLRIVGRGAGAAEGFETPDDADLVDDVRAAVESADRHDAADDDTSTDCGDDEPQPAEAGSGERSG